MIQCDAIKRETVTNLDNIFNIPSSNVRLQHFITAIALLEIRYTKTIDDAIQKYQTDTNAILDELNDPVEFTEINEIVNDMIKYVNSKVLNESNDLKQMIRGEALTPELLLLIRFRVFVEPAA